MYVYTHRHRYTCTYMYVCMYVFTISIHIYIYSCICLFISWQSGSLGLRAWKGSGFRASSLCNPDASPEKPPEPELRAPENPNDSVI